MRLQPYLPQNHKLTEQASKDFDYPSTEFEREHPFGIINVHESDQTINPAETVPEKSVSGP